MSLMKECPFLVFEIESLIKPSYFFYYIGAQAFHFAEFGQGTGRSVLSYVYCRGTEATLVSCSFSTSYCSHTEDAGVRCQPNG